MSQEVCGRFSNCLYLYGPWGLERIFLKVLVSFSSVSRSNARRRHTVPQSMIFAQQAKTLTSALVHSPIAVQKMQVLNPIISAIIHSDICFYQKLHSHGGAFDHLQANLFISGRYSANCMLQLLAKKQKTI